MDRRSANACRLAAIWALGVFCLTPAQAAEAPLWVAICGAELAPAIAPLAAHRQKQGFEVQVLTHSATKSPAEAVAALPRKPAYLLLVGDDDPAAGAAGWQVPAPRKKLYRWRAVQAPEFAADASLGDLDGDGLPEVPVGRIPFRTRDEVAAVVRKTTDFENRPASLADLTASVWSGSPEYGPAIDAIATGMLLSMVDSQAPLWTAPAIIAGDPRHALCGWPPEQPAVFAARCRTGLLSVMMGHSSEEHFLSMSHGGEAICCTEPAMKPHLQQGPPGPPCVMFTCLAGNFARPQNCLAESLLSLPGGPAAVIAATTESHPLTNYLVGKSLLPHLQTSGSRRIGPLWLAAQRQGFRARDFLIEKVLAEVEGKLEEKIDEAKLRRDQLWMYGILGDPALRLPLPEPLTATIEPIDGGWKWTAARPAGATALEVGHRPPLTVFAPRAPLPPAAAAAEQAAARKAAEEANGTFAFRPLAAPGERWEGVIREPGVLRLVAQAPGKLYVAAFRLSRP